MTPHPAKVQTMDAFVVSCHDINVTRRLCQPLPQKSHVDRRWTSRPLTLFRQCCHCRCHNDQAHDATALPLRNPPCFPQLVWETWGRIRFNMWTDRGKVCGKVSAQPQGRDEPSTGYTRHTLEVRGSGSDTGKEPANWNGRLLPCLTMEFSKEWGVPPTTARTWA